MVRNLRVQNQERYYLGSQGNSKNSNSQYRILLLYVWANTDTQSLGNLHFFIRHGVRQSHPVDFYFILQKVDGKVVNESILPLLPSNAHYIQHDNQCYDIGTFGWFFNQSFVDTSRYKYFIFMNTSIRGPFLTAALMTSGLSWFDYYIKRLSDQVKLVGTTINCEKTPHVQSYTFVTDQTGLAVLRQANSTVFTCHSGHSAAVTNGELEASRLIIRANYNIASLQTKYQGVDFRKKSNAECNRKKNPMQSGATIDGISHDPFELLFVKFRGTSPFRTEFMNRAEVYQRWLEKSKNFSEKN